MNPTTLSQIKSWVKEKFPGYNWVIRKVSHRDALFISISSKPQFEARTFQIVVSAPYYMREPKEQLYPYFHAMWKAMESLVVADKEADEAELARDDGM